MGNINKDKQICVYRIKKGLCPKCSNIKIKYQDYTNIKMSTLGGGKTPKEFFGLENPRYGFVISFRQSDFNSPKELKELKEYLCKYIDNIALRNAELLKKKENNDTKK